MLNSFARWFLVWFLAAIVLLCLSLGIQAVAATDKAASTAAAPADAGSGVSRVPMELHTAGQLNIAADG